MKKLIICAIAAVMLGGMTACDKSHKEMTAFAVDFAGKASRNKLDSVRILYPELDADSLALAYHPDSIVIEETGRDGVFRAVYSRNAEMTFSRSEDGRMQVIATRGIYAYPQADVAFAKGTGLWDDKLDDRSLKERMAQLPAVKEFAKKSYKALNEKRLSVKIVEIEEAMLGGMIGNAKFVVTNTGNVPVSGKDYNVICNGSGNVGMGVYESYTVNEAGRDVAPGESVSIPFDYIGSHGGASIRWKNKSADIDMDKDYKPTGKEWADYQASGQK